MNPIGSSFGEKWIIVGHEIETTRSTVHGTSSSVRSVDRYWTGSVWSEDARLALTFDSETDVNEFIEQNRSTLEA